MWSRHTIAGKMTDCTPIETRMDELRCEIADLWDEYTTEQNNMHEGYIGRADQLMHAINVLEDEYYRLLHEFNQTGSPGAAARGGSPIPE